MNNFLAGLTPEVQSIVFLIISLWSVIWKGIALWKASQKNHKYWFVGMFVALLVINTFGLLEIAYIYYFSKRKGKGKKK